jgi:hypothetical protein
MNFHWCRICGHSLDIPNCHACPKNRGLPCYWVEEDLCSRCADELFGNHARQAQLSEFGFRREEETDVFIL